MHRYITIRCELRLRNVETQAYLKLEAKLASIPNENWGGANITTYEVGELVEVVAPDGSILEFGDCDVIFVTTAKWYAVDDIVSRVYDILETNGVDYDAKFSFNGEGDQKVTRSEYEWHRCH